MTLPPGRTPRVVIGVLALAAAAGLALAFRARERGRSAPPPATIRRALEGPDTLLADRYDPDDPVSLLWYRGGTTSPTADGRRAVVDAGVLLVIDSYLGLRQPQVAAGIRIASAVSVGSEWLLTLEDGSLHRGVAGSRIPLGPAPFGQSRLVPDGTGAGAWAVRTALGGGVPGGAGSAPLLVRLDGAGTTVDSLGRAEAPEDFRLGEPLNAGAVAVIGQTVYYAPARRNEIIAFGPAGDTLWRSGRGAGASSQPMIRTGAGRPVVALEPVSEGLVEGPDGNLYRLGQDGTGSRLDVFEPTSGRHLRTARLAERSPTLAVNSRGRLYRVEPVVALGGPLVEDREPAPRFDLERLGGGRLATADLLGHVTVVNFWASWCAPCREELPALDTLQQSIADPAFVFVAVNEDVDDADALAFLAQWGFRFPVALGRGEMRHVFHNRGIPFTVLFDRRGRIARRWLGYGGPEHMAMVRTVVEAELRRAD